MNNNEILNKYFIWEEKNSTDHQKNYENKNVSEINDTMTNTKTDSTQIDWRNITEPKLRTKMRRRAWEKDNKDKIRLRKTQYYKNNDLAWNKRQEYIKTWKNNKRKNDINYNWFYIIEPFASLENFFGNDKFYNEFAF